MQEGFNLGTKYRAAEPTDPWRDTIMSLKLKVAHGSFFPYFVVGSREFKDVSEAVRVCIVDTIIGSVLAGKAMQERANNFNPEDLEITNEEFDQLSDIDQDEFIEHWFIGVQVDMDATYNPVFQAEYDLWKDLTKIGL